MSRFTSIFCHVQCAACVNRNTFLFTNKKAPELRNVSLLGIITESLTEIILKNGRKISISYLLNIAHKKKVVRDLTSAYLYKGMLPSLKTS